MRPPLTKTISLEDFQNYYWLKADAIAAWNEIKTKPGSNAYIPQKVEN